MTFSGGCHGNCASGACTIPKGSFLGINRGVNGGMCSGMPSPLPAKQVIRKSFRDEYLDDLVESGDLAMSLSESGGTVYRLGK